METRSWIQTKKEELPDWKFLSYQPTPETVDCSLIFVILARKLVFNTVNKTKKFATSL